MHSSHSKCDQNKPFLACIVWNLLRTFHLGDMALIIGDLRLFWQKTHQRFLTWLQMARYINHKLGATTVWIKSDFLWLQGSRLDSFLPNGGWSSSAAEIACILRQSRLCKQKGQLTSFFDVYPSFLGLAVIIRCGGLGWSTAVGVVYGMWLHATSTFIPLRSWFQMFLVTQFL